MADKHNQFRDLVQQKIESVRTRLLDLSARNPLISTQIRARSNNIFQIINTDIQSVLHALQGGNTLKIRPLPALEEAPPDEASLAFRKRLAERRQTDSDYLRAIETLRESEEGPSGDQIERDLRDRVRQDLGLPPRESRNNPDLRNHARLHNIDPSYKLSWKKTTSADDTAAKELQTLWLPEDLDRKLGALRTKYRTSIEETGINVLHLAIGFLHWKDPRQNKEFQSPLLLVPLKLEAKRTAQGQVFSVTPESESMRANVVLQEKLQREFGIDFPEFDPETSPLGYLRTIADAQSTLVPWRLRKSVVLGVFPSHRLAMFHDLEQHAEAIAGHPAITDLLCGTEADSNPSFAEDYDVDSPEVEETVPYLVQDADASQFSACVDVAAGKNVALEGPPGTGKSQTIVNVIAQAMQAGKSVLFVASKQAALDVVRARLEAVQLGEFVLPFLAGRTSRLAIIESVRERLEMNRPQGSKDYHGKYLEFNEARTRINRYLELSKTSFGSTGLTIHEILAGAVPAEQNLKAAGISPQLDEIAEFGDLPASQRSRMIACSREFQSALRETTAAGQYWKGVERLAITRFEAEQICRDASRVAETITSLSRVWAENELPGNPEELTLSEVSQLQEAVDLLRNQQHSVNRDIIARALAEGRLGEVLELENDWSQAVAARASVEQFVSTPRAKDTLHHSKALWEFMRERRLRTVNFSAMEEDISDCQRRIEALLHLEDAVESFKAHLPFDSSLSVGGLLDARSLVKSAYEMDVVLHEDFAYPDPLRPLDQVSVLATERQTALDRVKEFTESDPETISIDSHDTLNLFRMAGPFSFFNGKYRAAKRLLRSISRNGRVTRESAQRFLEAVHGYQQAEAKIQELTSRNRAVAIAVDAYGADADRLTKATAFYRDVHETLGDPKKSALVRPFFQGRLSSLLNLPDHLHVERGLLLSELGDKTTSEQQALLNLENEHKELKGKCSFLLNPEGITIQDAFRLTENLARFQDLVDTCEARFSNLTGESASCQDAFPEDFPLSAEADVLRELHEAMTSSVGSILGWCLMVDRQVLEQDTIRPVFDAAATIHQLLDEIGDRAGQSVIHNHDDIEIARLREVYAARSEAPESLIAFSRLASARQSAGSVTFKNFLARFEERPDLLDHLPHLVGSTISFSMARAVYKKHGPELSQFAGSSLERLREQLQNADLELRRLAQQVVRYRTYRQGQNAPAGKSRGRKSDYTNMALVRHQAGLKRPSASIRKLVQSAISALQSIKPCWMMAPSDVAELLPMTSDLFDLCIIDEASQMPPEDALGAIARSKQALIVGDTNQLPPTSFFRSFFDETSSDDDETIIEESVLELANTAFRPPRQLRWHYRSLHSSLIRFSNHHIYGDRLTVFPSAHESELKTGLDLVEVGGTYQGSRNPKEASAIVQAATRFMETEPDKSLGIVVMNQPQRDLVIEELERAISASRAAQDYQTRWTSERDGLDRLFVKNLENVQGDERDVIFIGTVYGPQKKGAPVMNRFGPINGKAGERRLNVLFSRARERIVTFTSLKPSDIQADPLSNRGAALFRAWLEFSATGQLPDQSQTTGIAESPLEEFVADQIRALGYEVDHQIGVSGYAIDLGVRHESWPFGYIIGVECDGATYHSHKSARDRDRLRQEVLESRGWKIHRVWSTDWFENPAREVSILAERLEQRLADLRRRRDTEALATQSEFVLDSANEPIAEDFDQDSEDSVAEIVAETQSVPNSYVQSSGIDAITVGVGDRVEVEYLPAPGERRIFRISDCQSDPSAGVINTETPLATALIGAEEGEIVEYELERESRAVAIRKVMKDEHALADG